MIPPLVLLLLAAMLLQAAGEATQKRGLDRRSITIWLLGTGLAVASVVGTIQALAHLDLMLVSTLGTTKILFASLIAVAFLGERLARAEALALVGIFAGAVLLALDAATSGSVALSTAGSVWLVALAALVAGGLAWLPRLGLGNELPSAAAAGVLLAVVNVVVKVAAGRLEAGGERFHVLRPGSPGELASLPELWLVVVSLLGGLALLQLALARGRYALVGPLVTVTIAGVGTLLGVGLFGETLGPQRAGGIALVLSSVIVLARRAPQARATASSPVTPPLISS